MNDKYGRMDLDVAFGFLANAFDKRASSDGDTGASFPRSDAEDMSRGARFIPGEVTMARRHGDRVTFVSNCGPCCWYWQLPDGRRIYHFERYAFEQIKRANGITDEDALAGPCPDCGNEHTNGGVAE